MGEYDGKHQQHDARRLITLTRTKVAHCSYATAQRYCQQAKAIIRLHICPFRRWWNLPSERKNVIFTGVIAFATLGYFLYAGLQWKVMDRTLTEIKQQSTAARLATEAEMIAGPSRINLENGEVLLRIKNAGHVAATHVSLQIEMVYEMLTPEGKETPQGPIDRTIGSFSFGTTAVPPGEVPPQDMTIPPVHLRNIKTYSDLLVLGWRFDYFDGFRMTHSESCSTFFPLPAPGRWSICPEGESWLKSLNGGR
jgi:hypothetical protein